MNKLRQSKLTFFLAMILFFCFAQIDVFAQEADDMKMVIEEINRLKQRVGVLEQKVTDQDEIIKSQRRIIEKVSEISPEIKQAMLPPEPKVLVKEFILEGVYLFDEKDFEPVLGIYRNKQLGKRELEKVADDLTTFYRSKGYITSLAYLPPQEISDNVVTFSVIEGRVGEVTIEEGQYAKKEVIKSKLLVKQGQILDYERVEKSIKAINKHPDREAKAVLLPGKDKASTDLLVKVEDTHSPWHFGVDYNNRGTDYTGKNRFGFSIRNTNLLGNDEMLSARVQVGKNIDEVYAGVIDYNFRIFNRDTRLGFYGLHSHADIGGPFQIIDPRGKATMWGVYVKQPLFDQDFGEPTLFNLSSVGIVGLDSASVHNEILGQETSHDELRMVKAGISFDEEDSLGRTFINHEIKIGVADFLGSMDEHDVSASRLDSGAKFTKYTSSFNRVNRLPFSTMLVSSFRVQLTDNPLVNSEQLSLGGVDSIRGFPENEYLADYGWISSFELRMPAFLIPSQFKVPFSTNGISLRDSLQFVGFVDFGTGYLKQARVGEMEKKSLIGAGFGLRYEFNDHLRGKIDIGFPMGKEEPSDGASSKVHVGVQYEF